MYQYIDVISLTIIRSKFLLFFHLKVTGCAFGPVPPPLPGPHLSCVCRRATHVSWAIMCVSPRCCYLPLRPAVCLTDPPVFCNANSRWRSAETGEQVCLQCQSLPTLWAGFYGCCANWQHFLGGVFASFQLPVQQRCCCCRFKRVGALFSSPSFIHSGM